MALAPGTRLGLYEIVDLLGAGGMGEVYRARDTKLHREIAIKTLQETLVADRERLIRFEREAQTLAALHHPNIATIFGLEEAHATPAIAMELVEGPTLAERIARGPLPLGEALPIARQLVDALDAAHEKGIIHRDLKPANIKLTPEGVVKVLDFGLAKAAVIDQLSNPANSPTMTVAATQVGVILGTAAYMAPEQARGQPVDRRADIWAFACVLFEMLTSKRAFDGDTISDTIAHILERDPDWAALPPQTPAAIRKLLERCLRKNAAKRLHDIADALPEIDDATGAAESDMAAKSAVVGSGSSRRGRRVATAAAAGMLAGGVLVGAPLWYAMRPAPAAVVRLAIAPTGAESPSIDGSAAISP